MLLLVLQRTQRNAFLIYYTCNFFPPLVELLNFSNSKGPSPIPKNWEQCTFFLVAGTNKKSFTTMLDSIEVDSKTRKLENRKIFIYQDNFKIVTLNS